MPGPYDYTTQAAQPIMAGLQGLQGGLQIAQQAQQMQAAQQKQQRQQQYRQQSYALSQNPNATAQDYVDLQAQYPEFAEGIKALNSARSDAQIRGDLNIMQKVNAAISAGQNDLAVEQLNEYSTALKNSGREDEVAQVDSIAEAAKQDPSNVKSSLYQMLLAQMGPKEFMDYYQQQERLKTGLQAKGKQKTGAWLVVDDKNNYSIVTGSYDPATGALTTSMGKLPEGMKLVSSVGETPEQKAALDVLTAGQKKQAEISAKSGEERTQSFIDQGLAAAESLPTIKRSLELLDTVKTGGFNKALIGAKQFFGIEGADEGELSYNLSKNVLGQLKTTFGAQFTEKEGARLDRIEAGLGRNPATNRAILDNAIKMAERKITKAISIAKKKGDTETVQELQDLMKFTLSPSAGTPQPTPVPTPVQMQPVEVKKGEQTATNPKTGEKLVYRNGQWLNINTGVPVQ